jgi:hypothetical protein
MPLARVQQIANLVVILGMGGIVSTARVHAQVVQQDPAAVQGLLRTYNEQLKRRPDSAYTTLRTVLFSASREDSEDVSRYALIEGNRLFRLMNIAPRLDSLNSANLNTHVDSLSIAIRYLSLSDSVRSTAETNFFLSVSYYYRARTEAVLGARTDECNEWWAVHNDATLAQQYGSRRNAGTRDFMSPRGAQPSLLDYADTMLRTRCKGAKAAV